MQRDFVGKSIKGKVYCSRYYGDNANEITLWGYFIYIKEMIAAA